MNFTDAPAPVNFPKLIKCRRARRPNMVRDGSKNGIPLKAGLHARTAHTILPLPLSMAVTVGAKKEIAFLTNEQPVVASQPEFTGDRHRA